MVNKITRDFIIVNGPNIHDMDKSKNEPDSKWRKPVIFDFHQVVDGEKNSKVLTAQFQIIGNLSIRDSYHAECYYFWAEMLELEITPVDSKNSRAAIRNVKIQGFYDTKKRIGWFDRVAEFSFIN